MMQTTTLGQTGLHVSRLGLGLAALGRPGYINLGHADDLRHDYHIAAMERQAHAVLDEAWRRRIAMTVAGLGMAGALFTGGSSLVVAGIIDAFLVADKTSNQISQWISAQQYSALVIDEMTAETWREPAVTELMASS